MSSHILGSILDKANRRKEAHRNHRSLHDTARNLHVTCARSKGLNGGEYKMDEKVENALNFIKTQIEKHPDIVAISSFGKDSTVLLHLVTQVKPDIPIIWVKTPFKPQETIDYAKALTEKWSLNLVKLESQYVNDKEFMENIVYKPNLPQTNPENCCSILKDEPMFTYIQQHGIKAWFSGLRRTESEKREMFTEEWKQGEFTKLHPLLDWTELEIWKYIQNNNIPYHPWYLKGYRSLGCECCSYPTEHSVQNLDELIENLKTVKTVERAGRWKDTNLESGGCGLHCIPPLLNKSEWHSHFGKD